MKRDEAIIHGIVLLCLLVSGFLSGFSFPVILGVISVLLIHYRFDFMPHNVQLQQANKPISGAIEHEVEVLKERMNQLNAALAFKGIGKKPEGPGK